MGKFVNDVFGNMQAVLENVIILGLLFAWMAGIVLAKGFIWTSAACLLILPAYYLVVEKILQQIGWVAAC